MEGKRLLPVVGLMIMGVSTPSQGFVGSTVRPLAKRWIFPPSTHSTPALGISSTATAVARAVWYRGNIARMATADRSSSEGSVSELTFDNESWKNVGCSRVVAFEWYAAPPDLRDALRVQT